MDKEIINNIALSDFEEKQVSSKIIYQGKVLTLRHDEITLPDGNPARREVLEHPGGVVIIPVLPNGQIVLIRRKDDGRWSLPGGMVDWGEDVPHAVRRELMEETGLEVVTIRRLVGVYSSPNRDPRIHSICITVEVEVQGKMAITDPLEVMEIHGSQ